MSIVEYRGPTAPQEIRKYLMRRPKERIIHEYLRLWREYGELEAERDALAALLASASSALDKITTYERFDNGTATINLEKLLAVRAVLDADPGTSHARRQAEEASHEDP